MPAPTAQPAWFNPTWYAEQKWVQHNVMYPDDQWASVEDYNQALAGFNATNWENWFTEYGNADNVSPNPLFDEAYYFTALAASSNAARTDGRTDWTPTSIKDYLKTTYNASGWDHYTLQGQFEGLNPSADFDTNAYYQIRVNMLNEYNNGAGWDDRGWTVDEYKEILREAQINPIMDLYLNTDYGQPNATQVIAKVENPLTVDPNWTPWGEGSALTPVWTPEATQNLTSGTDLYTGATGVETLFTAIRSNGSDNTLNTEDQIHADASVENHLSVTMKADFPGFSGVSGTDGTTASMTGVSVVDLINNDNAQYSFNAVNTQGVQTWNLVDNALTSALSLSGLPSAGITVNIQNQKQGSANINFNNTAVATTNSALTLGLNNVGQHNGTKALPIEVSANSIENLTVNGTGSANYVDLDGIEANTLNVTGSALLDIQSVDDALATIDAHGASGALYINATGTTALKTAVLGSNNDILAVKSFSNTTATIDGGAGTDTLRFLNSEATVEYNLNTANVEVLTVEESTDDGNLTFDGTYMQGLTTLNVIKADGNVELTNLNIAPTSAFTVNIQGNYGTTGTPLTSDITVGNAGTLKVTVGDGLTNSTDIYADTFTANNATTMELNLTAGGASNPTAWQGYIMAKDLTQLTVNSNSQYSSMQLDYNQGGDTPSNLKNVSQLNLNGTGTMDFHFNETIGQDAANLQVSAGNLDGAFKGTFTGNANVNNQGLNIITNSGADMIKVNANYQSININTGSGNDIVDLTAYDSFDDMYVYINLGGDAGDIIYVKNSAAKASFQTVSHFSDAQMAQVQALESGQNVEWSASGDLTLSTTVGA